MTWTRRVVVWLAYFARMRRQEAPLPYDKTHSVDFRVRFPRFPATMDCSEFVSWCYWNAFVSSDPSGNNWENAYTKDMWEHGHRVSVEDALPGDLVFYYSGGSRSHVALYLGGGEVMTKGDDVGPVVKPMFYRSDFKEIRSYL